MKNKFSLKLYNVSKSVASIVVKTKFNYKVIGLENIPETDGVILAGNHISLYDPILVALTCARPVNFMAKKELFKYKISDWFLRNIGAFPVDRDNPDIKTIKYAIKLVRDDNVLGIFPEGTRSQTEDILPFKEGAEKIAKVSKTPIVPFSIVGKYNHKNGVILEYGTPIYLEELNIPKNEYDSYIEDTVKKMTLKNKQYIKNK